MESARERCLFTSCDVSKKRASGRSDRVSFFLFLLASQRVNKIVQALSMELCFYFIHAEMFSY